MYEPGLEQTVRAIIVSAVAASTVGWRYLWAVWLQAETKEERGYLARHLAARFERAPRALRSLPAWVAGAPGGIGAALAQPGGTIASFCDRHNVPLHEMSGSIKLPVSFGVGKEALRQVLARNYWVGLSSSDQFVNWARANHLDAQCAMVGRLLEIHAGEAQSAVDLDLDLGLRESLKHISVGLLGDPADRPGVWAKAGDRARQVMEWLLLATQLEAIMEAFRRTATRKRRAEFWARYLHAATDAHLTTAGDGIAVCLLRIGTLLVVEFGRTGNACYVYGARGQGRRLRQHTFKGHWGPLPVAAYKQKGGLKLDRTLYPYVTRLIHSRGWNQDFSDFLRDHRIWPAPATTHREGVA